MHFPKESPAKARLLATLYLANWCMSQDLQKWQTTLADQPYTNCRPPVGLLVCAKGSDPGSREESPNLSS